MDLQGNTLAFLSQTLAVVNNLALKEERHLLTTAQKNMCDAACDFMAANFNVMKNTLENNNGTNSNFDTGAAGDTSNPFVQ